MLSAFSTLRLVPKNRTGAKIVVESLFGASFRSLHFPAKSSFEF
jgi:hypothetical protein